MPLVKNATAPGMVPLCAGVHRRGHRRAAPQATALGRRARGGCAVRAVATNFVLCNGICDAPCCQDEYILHGPVTLPLHSIQRPRVSPIQSPRHGVSGDTRGFPGGINVTNPLGWRHRRTLSPLQAHDSNQRPLIKPTWCERVVTIQCCKQLYFAHSEADQNAERITQSLEAHDAVRRRRQWSRQRRDRDRYEFDVGSALRRDGDRNQGPCPA